MTPYAYVFDRYRRSYEAQLIGKVSNVRAPGRAGLVSVVLPVYNGEDYIEHAVASVTSQSYSDFELIVVDDGSRDGTAGILARLGSSDRRIRLIRQHNQGLPKALNTGFRAATGEFLTWTSADNVLKPRCLEALVAELRAHPDRDLVYANLDIIGPDGAPLTHSPWFAGYQVPRGSEHVHLPTDPSELNIWPNNYVGAAFMYKASVPYIIGDYSRHLFGLEDYDYWMRLNAVLRLRHTVTSEPIYDYRFHDTSLTARDKELRITARRDALMVFEEFRRDFQLAPTLWCVTDSADCGSLARSVIDTLRTAGRKSIDERRLKELTLPSLWCPAVYLHVTSKSGCTRQPPADLPDGMLRVILVDDADLRPDVHNGWHLALALGPGAVPPRTASSQRGWLAADKLGDLLQAAELRAKAEQLAAIETLIHEPPQQPLDVSVIVCTYRRCDLLVRTVESLASQHNVDGLRYEIVIVNNDPDDHSVTTLVERMRDGHFSRMPDRLRLIDCPFPGLSFARNFGIAASRGSVLLFLDDDSVPEGGWLHAMSTAFSNHPDAGVIGGAIQVVLPEPKPSWLAPDWRGYWSQFDPPAQVYQTVKQYWEQPYGANWGARREALVASGGFRTAYGRKGNDFGGGEELIAGCIVQMLGYSVGVEPRSVVQHAVDPARFTLKHVAKTIRAGINVGYQCQTDLYFQSGATVRLSFARALRFVARSLRSSSAAERRRQFAYAAAYYEIAMRQLRDYCLRFRKPWAAGEPRL
jgi:glycosyltransferase involved in cell wall biosynthesis